MSSTVDIFSLEAQTTDDRIVAQRSEERQRPRKPSSSAVTLLDVELREQSERSDGSAVRVPVLCLDPGPLDLDHVLGPPGQSLGVLVLEGLLLVQLEAGRGHVGWLVGESDLLRPWEMPELSLTSATTWRALEPTRIVPLDSGFAARSDPRMMHTLLSRCSRTAHWLLAKSLIVSCPVLEDRLMLLFALLGERWGKVTADGILVDLSLTHEVLATMCGARRPSVTVALGQLRNDGVLRRTADGRWLLARLESAPPSARLSAWKIYARALGLA
jgi:CRP/FNR family cyclic AMP-dependent transcriptional regulator